MTIQFLGQGFEAESPNSVGNKLRDNFASDSFNYFLGISAFASVAGVNLLSGYITGARERYNSLNLIVGVDQEGTSREALTQILGLDLNSYVFYQNEPPIFHPKIYLFEGATRTSLIVGSSNLTARGIFGNIESSLLIEFANDDEEGINLLRDLKTYFSGLFQFNDPNLFRLTTGLIESLVARGIVPTERTRQRKHRKRTGTEDDAQAIDDGLVIPRRATSRVPSPVRNRPATDPVLVSVNEELELTTPLQIRTLVWSKERLSRSDSQHVLQGSNPTGNLKLSQGGFRLNDVLINQETYFRNGILNHLNWVMTKPNSTTYEEAFCNFRIRILGADRGTHSVKLSHDSVRVANQNNTPTWLHWGQLTTTLQETNITGKTLNLYQLEDGSFEIEII
jgi:HKD family nuclease